jgi:hypothetical protein
LLTFWDYRSGSAAIARVSADCIEEWLLAHVSVVKLTTNFTEDGPWSLTRKFTKDLIFISSFPSPPYPSYVAQFT